MKPERKTAKREIRASASPALGRNLWGIGRALMAAGLIFGAAMLALMLRWPWIFHLPGGCGWRWAGGFLLGGGLVWLGLSLRSLLVHARRGALATDGVFACTRNPLYFAWLALIAPGVSLLLCSWALLPVSLGVYGVFRWKISAEEQALRERFGLHYERYAARTALFWPRGCLRVLLRR